MSQNTDFNEFVEIIKGLMLLLSFHVLTALLIFGMGFVIGSILGGYSVIYIWIVGSMGFLFLQLLYVLPLVNWLKRKRKVGMMKGVIIGAVITAQLNGSCALISTWRPWG